MVELECVVCQAIKVAAVVTGVLAINPWVEQVFPDLPAAARYAASALPEAVLVEVLAQLVFGWPRIDVRWSEHSDSTPVSSVTLRASRRAQSGFTTDVESDDSYVDLLFFHFEQLGCVVIELKTGKFKPEHFGRLGFHVALVDEKLRRQHHVEKLATLIGV